MRWLTLKDHKGRNWYLNLLLYRYEIHVYAYAWVFDFKKKYYRWNVDIFYFHFTSADLLRTWRGHSVPTPSLKIVQLILLYTCMYIFLLLDPVSLYLLYVYLVLTSTNSTGTSDVYTASESYKTFPPRPFILIDFSSCDCFTDLSSSFCHEEHSLHV